MSGVSAVSALPVRLLSLMPSRVSCSQGQGGEGASLAPLRAAAGRGPTSSPSSGPPVWAGPAAARHPHLRQRAQALQVLEPQAARR